MSDYFSDSVNMPNGSAVVVQESEMEPHSMGSYSIRLYAPPASDGLRFEQFLNGKIAPRDGSVQRLEKADIDGDGKPEVIVVVQSAGSGGWLSADAWSVANNQVMLLSSATMKPSLNPVHELIRTWNAAGDGL